MFLEAANEEKTMPVPASSVQVGEYFITATKQLRKVTKLDQGDQGQGQVYYLHKSALIPGRRFDSGHVTANPALLEAFAGDCVKQLSPTELADLRKAGVVLASE